MAQLNNLLVTGDSRFLNEIHGKIDWSNILSKPTIPAAANNGTLTIQKNGTNVQTFTANQSTNVTANITVPTKVSELTNDSGYTTNTGTVTQIKLGSTAYNPTSGVISLPAYPTDTDTKVTQTETTTDATYELLFSETADNTTRTEGARKSQYATFNPNKLAFTFGTRVSDSTIGEYSYAGGYNIIASGDYSHGEGGDTNATGLGSHAEGGSTKATGNGSHAEGSATTASGDYSHSEGDDTTASGESSHAEGANTTADGINSHAEGFGTSALGNCSHTEGGYTTASGLYSHAEGGFTTASGYCSHVEGNHTTANHEAQHVFGEYNIADPSTAASSNRGNYIEIVGNGSSTTTRSNARTLDWNGNEWLAGGLTIAGTTGIILEGSSSNKIAKVCLSSAENIDIGWDYDSRAGAILGLRSIDYSNDPGAFILMARDNDHTSNLVGTPSGSLQWNSNELAMVSQVDTKVSKSGDTMTGSLTIQSNDIFIKQVTVDLTKSNNNISNNLYRVLGIRDNNNKLSGYVQNIVRSDGGTQMEMYARNYKTDGSQIDNGVWLKVDKNGTRSVSVTDQAAWRSALGLGNATINKGVTGWGTSTGTVTSINGHLLIFTDKWFGLLWLSGTNDISINYVHTDGKAYNASGTGSVTWGNGKYKATRSGKNVTVTSTSNSTMTLVGL